MSQGQAGESCNTGLHFRGEQSLVHWQGATGVRASSGESPFAHGPSTQRTPVYTPSPADSVALQTPSVKHFFVAPTRKEHASGRAHEDVHWD